MMHEIERTLDGMKAMLHVTVDQLPEIAEWDMGEEYELEVKVKMKHRMEEEDRPMMATLEVVSMESV